MPNITSTEAVTIGHDDLRLLGRVLAATDALFLPLRASEWRHPSSATVMSGRDAFRCNGVSVSFPGGAAERKRAERLTDHCIHAGYLTARSRVRGRFLLLTDDAEDCVRQLCGLPGLWLAFETVRQYVRDEWTPEIALNDGRGWGDDHSSELAFVEALLLPALVRGVAESRSTIRGHVYYRRVADVPDFPPPEEVEPMSELAKLYCDELVTTRSHVLMRDVGSLELGEIPLPVAMSAAMR
jgi:hypothetical protein